MAWNIPKELMNNNPLSEEEVRKRYKEKGLEIIEYTYKNNRTKLLYGYLIMPFIQIGNSKEY